MSDHLSIDVLKAGQNPEVYYSREVNKEKDQVIREHVISLAQDIYQRMSQQSKPIEKISFSFDADKFSFVIHVEGGENISYLSDSVDPAIRQQGEQLIAEINQLGLLILQEKVEGPYRPIATPLPFQSISPHHLNASFLQRFIRFIQRFFYFKNILYPTIYQGIDQKIKDNNANPLKQLYIDPEKLFNRIKEEFISKLPEGLYEEDELDVIINEALVERINRELENHKQGMWDAKTLYELDILRLFKYIEKNGFSSQTAESLSQVAVLDIPLDQLVNITVKSEDQEVLNQMWKKLLNDCFVKGHLDQLVDKVDVQELILQNQYATQYLKALHRIPGAVKQALNPFLNELTQKQSIQTLRNHLLKTSALTKLEVVDARFKQEQELYFDRLQPLFKEFIQEKFQDASDGVEFAQLLAMEQPAAGNIQKILTKAYGLLSKKERTLFDQNRLQELLFNEIERVAVLNFRFTSTQLNNFKKARQRNDFQGDGVEKVKKVLLQGLQDYQKVKKEKVGKEEGKLDPKKQKDVDDLAKKFMIEFDQFLKKGAITLEVLKEMKLDPSRSEIDVLMWQHLLQHLLDQSKVQELASATELTPTIKHQLYPYLEARSVLQNMQVPETTRLQFQALIEESESKISSLQIQAYLKSALISQKSRMSQLLFSEEVLDNMRSVESDPSFFSTSELMDLMILSRTLDNFQQGVSLIKEDQKQIQHILEKYKNDQELGKKLKLLDSDEKTSDDYLQHVPDFLKGIVKKFIKQDYKKIQFSKIPLGISSKTTKFLAAYISQNASLAKISPKLSKIQDKAEKLLATTQTGSGPIEAKDKLSVKELGLLSRFALLSKKLKDFEKVLDFDPAVKQLSELSTRSLKLYQQIEKIMDTIALKHYPDGCLLAYVGQRKGAWLGKPLAPEELLTTYAADGFTHGAKLYHENHELYVSHLYGNHVQDALSLYQLCISDIWELDIAPLVNPEIVPFLQKQYGTDWQKVVNQKYQTIERDLHMKKAKRFERLANYTDRRLAAGFADHPTFFKLLGRGDVKGHERLIERDFDKLHRKFFGNEPLGKEQICSEFASKVTLVSMIQLNKDLSSEMETKFHQFTGKAILKLLENKGVQISSEVVDYLKGERFTEKEAFKNREAEQQLVSLLEAQSYSAQDIDFIIRLGNEEIFDLPYDKKERLKAIHPGRMVKLLVDKKCAKKKLLPKELSDLIDLQQA